MMSAAYQGTTQWILVANLPGMNSERSESNEAIAGQEDTDIRVAAESWDKMQQNNVC